MALTTFGGGPVDLLKLEKNNLQGKWTATSIAIDGDPEVEDEEGLIELVFSGDVVSMVVEGREKKLSYRLNPSQQPKQIDLVDPEAKDKKSVYSAWIYEITGDELKIGTRFIDLSSESIVNPASRPASFCARDGDHCLAMATG